MPTSFTAINNGDPLNPAQVNQFAAPINALETAVDALASPALADISDWPAGVSATEVGYLDGVTSSIQTQLNGKAASSHSHSAGEMPSGIDAVKIGGGYVSNTEFGYLDGVTSGIQTQLDGKAASSHNHAASAINSGQLALANGGTGANLSATGGAGQVLKQASTGAAITVGAIAASDIPSGVDATKIGAGSVSNTEFGYLDGVTSGIQSQIDGKAATSHVHSASDINSGTIATTLLGSGTADNTKFLRGDQTWAVPSGGGSGTEFPSSGSDGNVTISGSVTLTRDMYYDTLTLASGGILNPAGYRIFAKTIVQTGGKISAKGNAGTASVENVPGNGGAALAAAVLGGGGAGGQGGGCTTGNASVVPAAATSTTEHWGGLGGASTNGGTGGTGSSGSGAGAGAPGTLVAARPDEHPNVRPLQRTETYALARGGSGGGGGGGGGGDGGNGIAGGGGGGGARVVIVVCESLDLSSASGVLIEASGGAGGNSDSHIYGKGAGGGGQGGGGGYVGLYCNSVTGSLSNAIDVSGGNGGNGGNSGNTNGGGRGGRGGDGGNADFFRADTGVWIRARSAGAGSGTAAAAPSNMTGSTGGAGEVVRLSI